MKRFLKHIMLLAIPVLYGLIWLFYQADGYSDPFYMKIATPKQSSLIIGNSKASQAIRPQIVDSILPNINMFNYGFTVAHSPYGPAYLKSIKRKLLNEDNTGVFIVVVDPWSLSTSRIKEENPTNFSENRSFINELPSVSAKPNLVYLLKYYKHPYIKILERNQKQFVHDDGWFEVNVSMDSVIFQKRFQRKLLDFDKRKNEHVFSQSRLSYLYKTIDFLKTKGKVYVVRLPVHPQIMVIENELVPNFDEMLEELKSELDIPYFDFMPRQTSYTYTDGLHLHKDSGKEVSVEIANWIRETLD